MQTSEHPQWTCTEFALKLIWFDSYLNECKVRMEWRLGKEWMCPSIAVAAAPLPLPSISLPTVAVASELNSEKEEEGSGKVATTTSEWVCSRLWTLLSAKRCNLSGGDSCGAGAGRGNQQIKQTKTIATMTISRTIIRTIIRTTTSTPSSEGNKESSMKEWKAFLWSVRAHSKCTATCMSAILHSIWRGVLSKEETGNFKTEG